MNLTPHASEFLVDLAHRSIRSGLASGDPGVFDPGGCPGETLELRASFVTLTTHDGELRGCRGSLEARRSLAADVWHNAAASAFADPRFARVTHVELAALCIEISVLGPLEPMAAASEMELCRLLMPSRDGVVLEWRGHRATFLPQVWESLPDPRRFLAELKRKAGLPADFWARDLRICRYEVEKIGAAAERRAQMA